MYSIKSNVQLSDKTYSNKDTVYNYCMHQYKYNADVKYIIIYYLDFEDSVIIDHEISSVFIHRNYHNYNYKMCLYFLENDLINDYFFIEGKLYIKIKKNFNGDSDIVKFNTMGAINNSTAIYLSISDGKICRRLQSPTATSTQRTTKDGRVVNEEHYNGWMGKINNITTRESEYGKEWQVEINDGTMNVILSFKYSSGYAASFLKALPNVNLNVPVTFTPKATEVDGKKRTTLFLNQNGSAIKWAYTKDNPNGCPGLKQIKVKGQTTWDDSDMMEFLEAMVSNDILPNLNSDVPF